MATVDGEFLTDTPHNLISQGRFQHKDALLGSNADEGTFWILFALPGFSKDGPSLQNLTMFRNGVDIICWDLSQQQVLTIIIIPAKARDYGVTGVGLSVCLFVCLLPRKLNKTWTDQDEIFWEGS